MKKKGFTLIELLVVIAIIAMLLAILMPALSKVKKIAQRVVCGTNLKGLGTAQTVYAHDYDGRYTVQGGRTNPNWMGSMGPDDWQTAFLPWSSDTATPNISIGTSLYLLVREADVSPKSFVCPSGGETVFDGKNANVLDLVQLWDFGQQPYDRVSYSYHMPYKGADTSVTGNSGKRSRFAADGQRSASFAVMADKNPFTDTRLTFVTTATQQGYMGESSPLNWAANAQRHQIQAANSQPHDREGQNVVFADGSTRYETRSDVGMRNDNIYTTWNMPIGTDEGRWRTGTLSSMVNSYSRTFEDSMLMNDKAAMANFPHTTP